MKSRIIVLLTALLTTSLLIGCGAENTTTEPTETATETITEESTTEQIEEPTATPEETTEPTPEATEEASEETTAETEPEIESTETAEPEPTEEPTPETEPQVTYTYTDMSATMYAQQTVNVRDLPSTDGNKIGSLSTNDEITVTGQCVETKWYRFDLNGTVAYVSNKYVSETKVEVQQQASSSTSNSSGMSRNASDYRSISDLSELSQGAGWDTDWEGFCANYKNIEKVAYTYNGTTVLLYDYVWDAGYGTQFIFYDFTRTSTPWYRQHLSNLHSIIDAGGASSSSGFHPVSDWQVY